MLGIFKLLQSWSFYLIYFYHSCFMCFFYLIHRFSSFWFHRFWLFWIHRFWHFLIPHNLFDSTDFLFHDTTGFLFLDPTDFLFLSDSTDFSSFWSNIFSTDLIFFFPPTDFLSFIIQEILLFPPAPKDLTFFSSHSFFFFLTPLMKMQLAHTLLTEHLFE